MRADPTVYLSPNFADRRQPGHVRPRFQFTASGTERCGVLYVRMDLPEGADWKAVARKAARVAARRAGATEVTLHAISA